MFTRVCIYPRDPWFLEIFGMYWCLPWFTFVIGSPPFATVLFIFIRSGHRLCPFLTPCLQGDDAQWNDISGCCHFPSWTVHGANYTWDGTQDGSYEFCVWVWQKVSLFAFRFVVFGVFAHVCRPCIQCLSISPRASSWSDLLIWASITVWLLLFMLDSARAATSSIHPPGYLSYRCLPHWISPKLSTSMGILLNQW